MQCERDINTLDVCISTQMLQVEENMMRNGGVGEEAHKGGFQGYASQVCRLQQSDKTFMYLITILFFIRYVF